jgi:hypothetical protein
MKRKILLTLTILVFSIGAFAQTTLHVKGGIQNPSAAEKIGFDSAVTLNLGIDKYFTLGPEVGFGWVKWEDKGEKIPGGNVTLTEVVTTNLYSMPVLAVATIRLADMMESTGFMPYVSAGAGYSWTWYRSNDYKEKFAGFTWQVAGGAEIKLGSDSALSVIIEGGYRGTSIKNADSLELDMSGAIGRIGVSFPLEGSDY